MEKGALFPLRYPRQLQVVKLLVCSLVVAPFFCLEMKSVKLHKAGFSSFEQEVHRCLCHQLQVAEIKIITSK